TCGCVLYIQLPHSDRAPGQTRLHGYDTPLGTIPMLHQRQRAAMRTHRPHVTCREGCDITELVVLCWVHIWTRNNTPLVTIPMFHQCLSIPQPTDISDIVAHSPHIG